MAIIGFPKRILMNALIIISQSPEDTHQHGYQLGQCLGAGDVICLSGDLGAGKTTFAVGIGQGWGSQTPLTSPTFVIIHQHHRQQDQTILYHLDAYRLQGSADADTIGLDDIFDGQAVVLIEWAEHIQADLPPDCLWISLIIPNDNPEVRQITLVPQGSRSTALCEMMAQVWGKG
jgi:tRNA threonylcarbamoyladenosine biosynthesis protein TsaE